MENTIDNNQLTLKQQIENIQLEHPEWRSRKISKVLGISRSAVRYHINPGNKEQSFKRTKKSRKNNPVQKKVIDFKGRESLRCRKKSFNRVGDDRKISSGNKFKTKDLLEKIGDNPKCYLTGDVIDLNNPSSYNLDHKIPVSKGGDNSLENCGLASKRANQAKTDMTPEELFAFCKKVLEYNGYIVTKNEMVPSVT